MAAATASIFAAALCVLVLVASPAQAATASWSFAPSSWDFGVRLPGTGPSPPKAFTLTNTGQTDLPIPLVSLGSSGGDPDLFAITENTCGDLAPGASCEIDVTFDPSTPGPKTGQLGVSALSGEVALATVDLTGIGAGPAVSISPASQVFQPLALHAGPSPPKSFVLTNEGQLDLAIASLALKPEQTYNYPGASPEQFKLAGGTCTPGLVVPPGESCSVAVAFAPSAPGTLNAQLRIVDNAPGSPHVATVQGDGVAPPFSPPVFIAPQVAVVRHPPKRTALRQAVFWFRGNATATQFECKLDHGSLGPCHSPVRYQDLKVGHHVFVVRAFDGNGGSGSPPTRYRWLIR